MSDMHSWMIGAGLFENKRTYWQIRRTVHSPWRNVIVHPRKAIPLKHEASGSKFRLTAVDGRPLPEWLDEFLLTGTTDQIGATALYRLYTENRARLGR